MIELMLGVLAVTIIGGIGVVLINLFDDMAPWIPFLYFLVWTVVLLILVGAHVRPIVLHWLL